MIFSNWSFCISFEQCNNVVVLLPFQKMQFSEGEKESNTDDRSVGKWDMVTNSSSSSLQNRFQNLKTKVFKFWKKKNFMLLGNDLGGQYVAEKKKKSETHSE